MGIPARTADLVITDSALSLEIEKQLGNSTIMQYEILNQSQANMKDLEDEVKKLGDKKNEIDSSIRRNRENVRRLVALIERDEAVSNDLDVSIQGKLQNIHALRERGVTLPAERTDG